MSQQQIFREFTYKELVDALGVLADEVDEDGTLAIDVQAADGTVLVDSLVRLNLSVDDDTDGTGETFRWPRLTAQVEPRTVDRRSGAFRWAADELEEQVSVDDEIMRAEAAMAVRAMRAVAGRLEPATSLTILLRHAQAALTEAVSFLELARGQQISETRDLALHQALMTITVAQMAIGEPGT